MTGNTARTVVRYCRYSSRDGSIPDATLIVTFIHVIRRGWPRSIRTLLSPVKHRRAAECQPFTDCELSITFVAPNNDAVWAGTPDG